MDHLPPKALSIRQPWAWAIINAGNDVENRTWATTFRGRVCIHAAKGDGTWGDWDEAVWFVEGTMGHVPPLRSMITKGGIIGTAEIVDCVDQSESPWFFGPYGFVLRNVQPVEFIPVRGALSFFDWRANL